MSLYAWGANANGQLGLGYKSDSESIPKPVQLTVCRPEDIVSICGGSGHILILDKDGFVYCCGLNSKGQLGISDDTLTPVQIDILKEFRIVQISCGWDFSAAVSECGKQFVWGNNSHTQLGLSKSITCTGIPSRLQVSQKLATGFAHISCGMRHTLIRTVDNGLLVAGTGAKGQLGLGDNFDDNNYLSITKVPDMTNVQSIACGQHHSIVLKDSGLVMSWGENKWGQLGIDPNISNSFVPMEIFTDKQLASVYAGWTHSAALTKTGAVYTWGRNCYGQLGRDTNPALEPHFKPNLVKGIEGTVEQLSLGSEHNLAVTKGGGLWCWGWNEHGSCGTGSNTNVLKPVHIFKDQNVKKAFACTGCSFAVVE